MALMPLVASLDIRYYIGSYYDSNDMDRVVGEVFDYNGHRLRVMIAEDDNCFGCHLFGSACWREEVFDEVGTCFGAFRKDRTSVKFVEEKGGSNDIGTV